MTRERSYALRYVHAAGPFVMFVFFYAYFLGPWLTTTTGWQSFRFLDEWIMGIVGVWTGSENLSRQLSPGYPAPLGLTYANPWMREAGTTVYFLLGGSFIAIAATTAFLLPLFRGDELPARRKVGALTHLAIAIAWAIVLLAALCQTLQHLGMFEDFQKLTLQGTPPPTPVPFAIPADDESSWPFLGFLAIAMLVCWVMLVLLGRSAVQFWRLERLTFWVLAAAAGVLAWALVMRFLGTGPKWKDWGSTPAFENTTFLALSALLWAWTCRVILLFNFARFEREAAKNPDTSCFACGYDLRGSAHSESCPECGATIVVSRTVLEPNVT